MKKTIYFFCALLLSSCGEKREQQTNNNQQPIVENAIPLAIGTYTRKEGHVDGKAEGIYIYSFNPANGALEHLSTTGNITNPSYLNVHPNGKYIYAVSEVADDEKGAPVYAYQFEASTNTLALLNESSTLGNYPCYVEVSPSGEVLAAANYGSGNITLIPLEKNGTLGTPSSEDQHRGQGPNEARQESPHAHMAYFNGANQVLSTDLGTDQIHIYSTENQQLKIEKVLSLSAGAGPRHLAVHPQNQQLYVVDELKGNVSTFSENHELIAETSYLKNEGEEAAGGDIIIDQAGKYLYVSNRGNSNSITVFEISQELKKVGHFSTLGKAPRAITFSPDGKFLLAANQDSGDIAVFQLHPESGLPMSEGKVYKIPTPVCMKWILPKK
ncbi:lactonase family protein [Persicobacter sp. CCB-QB2]|uniref:lactonase family protein n=1 Tax=Persicobacter sp. CCB-QB2 TaxID=1561025 RepID=UPI0006A9C4C4|nr:lactonase family protein [Persicobacter sp. CCB-QB2]